MRISLRRSNRALAPAEVEHIERRLGFALDRFEPEVHRVQVYLQDVNGPRGGADLRCRMVTMVAGRELVVDDQGESFEILIDRICNRLAQRVSRTLERRREHVRAPLGLGESLLRSQPFHRDPKGE